jgi:hypothetical protein
MRQYRNYAEHEQLREGPSSENASDFSEKILQMISQRDVISEDDLKTDLGRDEDLIAALKALTNLKLVEVKAQGGRALYSLTKTGSRSLQTGYFAL